MNPERFVALDLETTGLDGRRDEIIEFGAVRVIGGEVAARFSSLARPGRRLPELVARLTGLSDGELAAAPPRAHALAEFLEFLGEDALVAHNAGFDAAFLSAATDGRFRRPVMCSLELARIVLPEARSHSLEALAAALELPRAGAHRAAADAETAARLWIELLARLGKLPMAVLAEMSWLLAPVNHPLKEVLAAAERAAADRGLLSEEAGYAGLFRSARRGAESGRERRAGEPVRLDPEQLAAALGPGGAVAGALDGFEPRPEQIEMCRQAAEAFSAGRHLALEAGTGVGKSLAYLVPAAAWARATGRRVVVSTNTKNLQAQLFGKDLPLLQRALPEAAPRAALLKGRRNYLCLRKLLALLRQAGSELDDAERPLLLPAVVWAPRSAAGDLEECGPLHLPAAADLREKLVTDGPDCLGKACPQRRGCFLLRARQRAQEADVIVANHALVLADLDAESPVLPASDEAVFDEAHNLEGVATDAFSVRLSPLRFYRALNRLFRFRRRGRSAADAPAPRRRRRRAATGGEPQAGTGLLPTLFAALGRARGLPAALREQLESETRAASEGVVAADGAAAMLFAELRGLWAGARGAERKLRYSQERRRGDLWAAPTAAAAEAVARLGTVRAACGRLARLLDEEAAELPGAEELSRDLAAAEARLAELIGDVDFTVRASDQGCVFWAELAGPAGRERVELWGAPLDVSGLLAEKLFARRRACILCSATMTVAGSFQYLSGRLGLDRLEAGRVRTRQLGTPFDFGRQALVLVPGWLPEPSAGREADGGAALAAMLAGLCRATRGRALALFTSYASLLEVYDLLKEELSAEGLAVLAQGRDGSRESLLEELRAGGPGGAVLLGTSSFWEGVDVRGPALSCLVLARLPFQVYTEPLFQARAELVEARGQDAFAHYSLPEAVLRFRQGFGRLIRSRADRGVAVLADRRLLTKRYGQTFLRSLPCGYRVAAGVEQLAAAAREFLAAEP